MAEWWNQNIDELSKNLKTNVQNGLSSIEAKQRLDMYGLNQLPSKKRFQPLILFLHQFSSPIVWVLIGALIVSGFVGEWVDAGAIGAIVFLNAVVGCLQEYRAKKSLEALKKLTLPTAHIIRNGVLQAISSDMLVPGDLVVIQAGDLVPADGRIVQAVQLATLEASLTGESVPVLKNTDVISQSQCAISERKNMAFMGTAVAEGKGTMIITTTGLETELGKIAMMLEIPEELTPMELQFKKLGGLLACMCLGIVGLVFLIGFFRGNPFLSILLTSLSLAVAAIPEGLPAVVTIALAFGVHRMAKRNVLVRRLASVETLGCTSVICTDKTGTLTRNEMVVTKLWVNETYIDVTGIGYEPNGTFAHNGTTIDPQKNAELMLTLKIGLLCNDATLTQANGGWRIIGDPTEGALLVAGAKAGLEKEALGSDLYMLGEIPFDSERKCMSVVRKVPGGARLFIKGAVDVIVPLSDFICIKGERIALSADYKKSIIDAHDQLAGLALRVLALAYCDLPENQIIDQSVEKNLVFVGLAAMIDPPRPEVKAAIQMCKTAGIRTIMITGDHKETAVAIGIELGLINDSLDALTGDELDQITDNELTERIEKIAIYARTSAQHKMRIVKAWKNHGHIVAVTGDGVNDAPAIKIANIGISMGITGAEVTKESSDMIITDDNFASIVDAVREGRGIYDNITKFVNYLLSANIAELLIIFIGTLFAFQDSLGRPYISLLPIQLLWLNLVTDGLPALALAMDPADPHIMGRSPRKPTEKIVSWYFAVQMILVSIALATGALVASYIGLSESAELGHTMTLTAFVLLEMIRVQMVRARYNIGVFTNKFLLIALTISLALQIMVIYVPFFQRIFKTVGLSFNHWVMLVLIILITWFFGAIVEFYLAKQQHKNLKKGLS